MHVFWGIENPVLLKIVLLKVSSIQQSVKSSKIRALEGQCYIIGVSFISSTHVLKNVQKTCKNVQKRAKMCKNVHLKDSCIKKRASQVLIYQQNVQKHAKTCKNVQKCAKTCISNNFWTQFKNVHLRGPCSLRSCISRSYSCFFKNPTHNIGFSMEIATTNIYLFSGFLPIL